MSNSKNFSDSFRTLINNIEASKGEAKTLRELIESSSFLAVGNAFAWFRAEKVKVPTKPREHKKERGEARKRFFSAIECEDTGNPARMVNIVTRIEVMPEFKGLTTPEQVVDALHSLTVGKGKGAPTVKSFNQLQIALGMKEAETDEDRLVKLLVKMGATDIESAKDIIGKPKTVKALAKLVAVKEEQAAAKKVRAAVKASKVAAA